MKLATVELNGMKFDAYYEVDVTKDPYGTGDSPTQIDISIGEISLPNNATNLIEIMDSYWIEDAKEQLAEIEWFNL
jgi:hypothetical protein